MLLYDCTLAALKMRKIMEDIFFFFQAEDGIRDLTVTGVQTCALPISAVHADRGRCLDPRLARRHHGDGHAAQLRLGGGIELAEITTGRRAGTVARRPTEIGRASCRERVQISVESVQLNETHEIT